MPTEGSKLEWFDEVFVISHPRTGRWSKAVEVLRRDWGVEPQRVYAKRPGTKFTMNNMRRHAQGEFGCNLSHFKAVMTAAFSNKSKPLFLEDDVCFSPNASQILGLALKDLPDDWGVLYLGGHPCEDVTRVGKYLVKVGRFSFAEAYAINGAFLCKFLDYWIYRIGQPHAMFDYILGEFARDNNGYAVVPAITSQNDTYSYVAERIDTGKEGCVGSGWKGHLKA